jgi:hypothetical protein
MAIRRPSISSPDWLFQDFLYQPAANPGGVELRYLQIKWDGEEYSYESESFDYSNPPYISAEQHGGSIVGQINYDINLSTKLVTVYSWSVNWRDEWPLRLALNYLSQCLYDFQSGYTVRVVGDEVYTSLGEVLEKPGHFPYAFWISEQYNPLSNEPNSYLVKPPVPPAPPSPLSEAYSFSSTLQVVYLYTYILVTITSNKIPIQTPLYWKLTGEITPAMLTTSSGQGVIFIDSSTEFLKVYLDRPVQAGLTGTFLFCSDRQFTELVGTTTITL